MRRPFSVQCAFATRFTTVVTVDAETLDDALAEAVEAAGATGDRRAGGPCGPIRVLAACEGHDDDPAASPGSLPVPDRFGEDAGLPVVSIGDPRDPEAGIRVIRGRVLLRFDGADGRVTAATPAPANSRPLITVRPRHDGAPDVTITGGAARVKILGYDDA